MGELMARRADDRKPSSGSLSGIAATLFPLRDNIAPMDTPEFRKKAGKLIAGATRPVPKPAAREQKLKLPED
jgi:hypothetical protein